MTDSPATGRVAKLTDIWKSYGAIPVLQGVSLALQAGEVHALLGGNGAGKSSLMKIMSGVISANSGAIEINGKPLSHASPALAQELGLYTGAARGPYPAKPECPGKHLSRPCRVATFAAAPRRTACWRACRFARSQRPGSITGNSRAPDRRNPAGSCARCACFDPWMNQPPHSHHLRPARFLSVCANCKLKASGFFFISHKLREIREICGTISVLRDGVIVLSGALDSYSDAEIIEVMSRVQIAKNSTQRTSRKASQLEQPRLSVSGLSGEGFRDINLDVRAGEILGLAGVVGAGRTEFAETLFGLRRQTAGRVVLEGTELKKRSPRYCIDFGLVYLPEDRQQHGLFLEAPLYWNVSSYLVHRLPFFLRPGTERKTFEEFRSSMGIKCSGASQEAHRLSGGNQQKILLAKCLSARPKVLILDEPTRGVDVAARNDIYELIRQLAADGVAIVLISSDFDELVELADRVQVMAFWPVRRRTGKTDIRRCNCPPRLRRHGSHYA